MGQTGDDVSLIDELNQSIDEAETQAKSGIEPKDNLIEKTMAAETIFDDEPEVKETPGETDDKKKETDDIIPEKKITKETATKTAERYVKALNGFQKLILPGQYRKNILRKGDAARLEEYLLDCEADPNSTPVAPVGSQLYRTLKRYEKLEKYITELPFNDDEIKEMTEPLAELVQEHPSLMMGPGASLVLSVGIIMAPRLEPMFPSFGNLFKSKNKDE